MKMKCYCGNEAARACIKYDTSDYWCVVKYFLDKEVKAVKFSFIPLFIQKLFWRTKNKAYGNAKLVSQTSFLIMDALRALIRLNDESVMRLYWSKRCIRLLLQIDDVHIVVFKLTHGGYLVSTKVWMHTSIERLAHEFKGYSLVALKDDQPKYYREMARAISANIIDCFSLDAEDLNSDGPADNDTSK